MKYRATAPATIGIGSLVALTPEQLHRRRYLVKPVAGRDGWHSVTAPLQFKAGEEFETDLQMSKSNTVRLDTEPAADAPPAAEAAAVAKPAHAHHKRKG
jgi:hypothetical protein